MPGWFVFVERDPILRCGCGPVIRSLVGNAYRAAGSRTRARRSARWSSVREPSPGRRRRFAARLGRRLCPTGCGFTFGIECPVLLVSRDRMVPHSGARIVLDMLHDRVELIEARRCRRSRPQRAARAPLGFPRVAQAYSLSRDLPGACACRPAPIPPVVLVRHHADRLALSTPAAPRPCCSSRRCTRRRSASTCGACRSPHVVESVAARTCSRTATSSSADHSSGCEHCGEDVIPARARWSADAEPPRPSSGSPRGSWRCSRTPRRAARSAGRAGGRPVGLLEGPADRPAPADHGHPRAPNHPSYCRMGSRATPAGQSRLPTRGVDSRWSRRLGPISTTATADQLRRSTPS